MNRSARLIARQYLDQPLDLPPAAEMDDISTIATFGRAYRRSKRRFVSMYRQKFGGIGHGLAIGQIEMFVHRCAVPSTSSVFGEEQAFTHKALRKRA